MQIKIPAEVHSKSGKLAGGGWYLVSPSPILFCFHFDLGPIVKPLVFEPNKEDWPRNRDKQQKNGVVITLQEVRKKIC